MLPCYTKLFGWSFDVAWICTRFDKSWYAVTWKPMTTSVSWAWVQWWSQHILQPFPPPPLTLVLLLFIVQPYNLAGLLKIHVPFAWELHLSSGLRWFWPWPKGVISQLGLGLVPLLWICLIWTVDSAWLLSSACCLSSLLGSRSVLGRWGHCSAKEVKQPLPLLLPGVWPLPHAVQSQEKENKNRKIFKKL